MSDLSVGKPLPTPIFSRGWVRETEPVRATIKRARRTRAHGVFVMPTGGSKTWFTLPQRDLICLLAVDPGVRAFDVRPFTLRLPIDAKQFDHTPDFRIFRAGEQAIVDITRPPNPEKDEHRELIARAVAHECAAKGYRYYRIEPSQIRTQPRFDNALEILRFKSIRPSEEFVFRTVEVLSRTGGVATIGMLVDALGGDPVPELYALCLYRILELDMDHELSDNTRVHLLAGGQH